MAPATYLLICCGLTVAVLVAMLAPAPARPVEAQPQISPVLLFAAVVAVLAMGSLALTDHHVAGVVCGAVASLIVVPCLWLARAPDPAGGWDEWEEDDGDDGGSPLPSSPFTPPAPDEDLPGLEPAGRSGARGAWTPAPAFAPLPATAQAALPAWALRQDSPAWASAVAPQFVAPATDLYDELAIDEAAWEPAPITPPVCEDDVRVPQGAPRRAVQRVRGEHRSLRHTRARGPHHGQGRRPASLRRRVIQACRRLLRVESPECRRRSRRIALAHGGRRHASRVGSRSGARRDTVAR